MSKNYEWIPGMFQLCSGVWDDKTKTFRKATEVETMWCCLNTCRPQKNYA